MEVNISIKRATAEPRVAAIAAECLEKRPMM
jgi:hypothetical protein